MWVTSRTSRCPGPAPGISFQMKASVAARPYRKVQIMALIDQKDALIFQEASLQMTLNLTLNEAKRVSEIAAELRTILEAAKNRIPA
jgi:hypothetical protein